MDNVIFNSLETILNEKKVQIDDLKQKLFGNLYTLQEEIDKVIENIEYFNDINLEELKNVNIIDEDIYLTLCLYKKLYNSKISSMKLNDNQLIQIRNQFLECKKLLLKKIDYLLNNNTDYINMVYQYEKLNNIYHQLERKEPLNEEEFVLLCNIFKDDLFKLKELILLNTSLYENIPEEKESVVQINRLDETELQTILESYNLNINDLSDFNKRKLLLYGNINNIRNILDILKENKINITFKENASKFIEILLLSNGSNVLTIISNIKEDLGNKFNEINLNEVFKQYITIPSIFIKGLKVYEKELKDREVREIKSNPSPNKDNLIFGGYNNYLLNRELFINEGIDLGIVLSTCPSVLPESNRKIKQNLLKYHMYNINNNDLLKTLSALKAICPLDVIDQFLEAGFYDYLLGCLTITLKGKNSEELYQLINAKRAGLSDEEMFLSYEVGNTGIRRKKRKLSVLGSYDSTGLSGIEEYHQTKREDLDNLLNEFELISDDVLNDSLIKKMDELFRKEDNVYNINGIIISRFKVLRFYTILLKNNLGNLENLKYVIFKNKILSQEEYKMVIDLLDNTLKTKDTKKSKRPVTEVIYISNEYVKHLIELLDDEFLSNNDCYVFDNIIINRRAVIGKLNAFFAYHRPGNNDEFNKLFGAIVGGENLGSENENKIKMILLQRVQSKLKMNGIGR